MLMKCAIWALSAGTCIAIAFPTNADWPTFEIIQGPVGWSSIQPKIMNADGSVIVGDGSSPFGKEGFVWRPASGLEIMGDLPGGAVDCRISGVSGDGVTAVGFGSTVEGIETVVEAVSWTSTGGFVRLGRLGPVGFTEAKAASFDGSAIAGSGTIASGSTLYVFRWDAGIGITRPLNVANEFARGSAFGISGDGSVIVGRDTSATGLSQGKAFIWHENDTHLQWLPLPENTDEVSWSEVNSAAYAANFDGSVILGFGDPSISGVSRAPLMWTNGEVSVLEMFSNAAACDAGDMSTDLRVIVGSTKNSTGTTEAVIWLDGTLMRLRDYFIAQNVPYGPGDIGLFQGVTVSDDGEYFFGVGAPAGGTVYWYAYVPLPPPPCYADVNGDTGSDVLDFLDFMDAFGQCETLPGPCVPPGNVVDADFNGDTIVDVGDFLDFFDAFGTGCTG
jgi:uncharacterized membrane protein